jgi:hypothetical protein
MKKFFAALSFVCASFSSFAGGPLDGIYSCNVYMQGYNYPTYVTLSGHSDGSTIFVPAAISETTYFNGYGIGVATNTSFTGLTMYGEPFSFTANLLTGALSGTIRAVIGTTRITVTASCVKIW